MPFLFTCPHCGTRTEVDDEYRGRSGQCVTCGQPIQMPGAAVVSSSEATAGPPARSPRRRSTSAIVAATVVLVVILGSLGFAMIRFGGRAVTQLQNSQSRVRSTRNLEKIAKALNAYAEDYGSYPPAFTADASGTPLHSWRVLILPYFGEDELTELYESIDLNRSWTSNTNTESYGRLPDVYRHPRNEGSENSSPYRVLVGKTGLFAPDRQQGPEDLIDDPSKTILVVEVQPGDFSQHWMEPDPLRLGPLMLDRRVFWSEMDGMQPGGIMVATVDGRAHLLPEGTPPTTIEALITPRGGEPLPDDVLESMITP